MGGEEERMEEDMQVEYSVHVRQRRRTASKVDVIVFERFYE